MQAFFERAILVYNALLVIGVVIGLVRIKVLSFDQKILLSLLLSVTTTEILSRVLWEYKTNNLFLYHFYSVIEFLLLGVLYTRNLNGMIRPVYMKGIMVVFALFAAINTLFFQSLKEFNSNVTFVESLLLITLSVLYFYKLLRDMEHKKLESVPMFWINMSVLTYFSGAFLLFHVANELISFPAEERAILWGTHALFNIVHYLLYGVALWVTPPGKLISRQ